MKIALPTENKQICAHFGHCQEFAVYNIEDNKIVNEVYLDPPVHQPGVYPRFLSEQGVDVVIAGGMGQKAQDLFSQNNIKVIVGIGSGSPKELTEKYLEGKIESAGNLCDH